MAASNPLAEHRSTSSQLARCRVLLGAALAAVAAGVGLPAGATVIAGPLENPASFHQYYLLETTNWAAAEAEAVGLGGHLATVENAAENTWLWETFSAIAAGPFWIGLSDAALEGSFVWTSGAPTFYQNWWTAGGEPNNAGGIEHSVEMNNYLWNDNSGTSFLRGLAEVVPAQQELNFVEAEAVPTDPGSIFLPDIEVSADGRYVYVLYEIGIGTDRILIYARGADGTLSFVDGFASDGNAFAMALSPDGSMLYYATNNGYVGALRRDATTGLLTLADSDYDGSNGAGSYTNFARGVAVSPDGKNIYVTSQENAVTTFTWDAMASTLTQSDVDVTGQNGLLLSNPGSILVTPDGKLVIVLSGSDNAMVGFARDLLDGSIDWVTRLVDDVGAVDGLLAAESLVAAPTGLGPGGAAAVVHVASAVDATVASFPVNPDELGPLTFGAAVETGAFPSSLAVSPNGERLFVADGQFRRVEAWAREAASGTLGSVRGAVESHEMGVEGLQGSNPKLAVSPDGRNVYLALSAIEPSVVVLRAPEPAGATLALVALLALSLLQGARRRAAR